MFLFLAVLSFDNVGWHFINEGGIAEDIHSLPCSCQGYIDPVAFFQETYDIAFITSYARQHDDVIFLTLVIINSSDLDFLYRMLS